MDSDDVLVHFVPINLSQIKLAPVLIFHVQPRQCNPIFNAKPATLNH